MAKKQFKAESKRLLDLMINSIYTHDEIFLREIISNASDAIDKLNHLSVSDGSVSIPEDLGIYVKADKAARTLTVSDNGIGMTKDDMDRNLGVIAHSGTLDFKNTLENDTDADIIGQFGVGFYSAFMVSKKVTVISKAFGTDQAYRWDSDGSDGYTIKECEKESTGTDVIMHIKDDTSDRSYGEFLETYKIKSLIKKYSDYIRWPIHMDIESGKWVETGETDESGEPKKEYVTTIEDKTVNSMKPIWQRSKDEISDEDCISFYKDKFRDYDDPVAVIRTDAEGAVSYKAMLFIPEKAPYDFYTRDFEPGLQLYSSGVLIMDKCADLIPYCFRFVRGIVDSPDISLNISREMLQHDRQLGIISTNLRKKIKNELERLMSEEPEKYKKFYKNFARQLKYGVVEDYGANRDMLKGLLMFHSMKKNDIVSLDEYVKEMPEGQDRIYYISSDTVAHASQLPQTEAVSDKGYDILCLTEDVDGFVMKTLEEFDGKTLCDVTADDLGIETEDEKKETEAKEAEFKDVLDFMKETLGGKVSVRLSRKLKNHAVFLTTEGNVTLEMEKYFENFPGSDEAVKAEKVLEINPSHPAFSAMKNAFDNDKEKAADLTRIMYAQASIAAGIPLENTSEYSELVFKLF